MQLDETEEQNPRPRKRSNPHHTSHINNTNNITSNNQQQSSISYGSETTTGDSATLYSNSPPLQLQIANQTIPNSDVHFVNNYSNTYEWNTVNKYPQINTSNTSNTTTNNNNNNNNNNTNNTEFNNNNNNNNNNEELVPLMMNHSFSNRVEEFNTSVIQQQNESIPLNSSSLQSSVFSSLLFLHTSILFAFVSMLMIVSFSFSVFWDFFGRL
jgi:hypothetical protein